MYLLHSSFILLVVHFNHHPVKQLLWLHNGGKMSICSSSDESRASTSILCMSSRGASCGSIISPATENPQWAKQFMMVAGLRSRQARNSHTITLVLVHSFPTFMRESGEDEVVQLLPIEKLLILDDSSITRLVPASSLLGEEHNLHGHELH